MSENSVLFDANTWLADAEGLGLGVAWRDGKVALDVGRASWRTWLLYSAELERHEAEVVRALRQRTQH